MSAAPNIAPRFTVSDLAYLAERRIPVELAEAAGWNSADAHDVARVLGFPVTHGGLVMAYPGNDYVRVRMHGGETRYLCPKAKRPPIFLPPEWGDACPDDLLSTLVVVEAPAKALALRAAGLNAIGLAGTRTTLTPDRRRLDRSWRAVQLQGVDVVVLFDAGRATNERVADDESFMADALRRAGALVRLADLPLHAGEDQGPDDFIARHGADALYSVIRAARPARLPTLDLAASIDRAERRMRGIEKPIPLPWSDLADHFGGGLWPGVHFLVSGTGVGKTQWALQLTAHALSEGYPVAYIGLELDAMQIDLRMVAIEVRVPWSHLYLGKVDESTIARARRASESMASQPLHPYAQTPRGWSASEVARVVRDMRRTYPEDNGPGSRPILVVLDFLQILGDERTKGPRKDVRQRIQDAAYEMRAAAIEFNPAILAISSVSRENYKTLAALGGVAALTWDLDAHGRPFNRQIGNPDAIVGLGKESGEIEYSADSVSVLAKVPGTHHDGGPDVIFATAKGRATGPRWSALHFTGFGYDPCADGGARIGAALKEQAEAREVKREAKKQKKEDEKGAKITADAAAIAGYVLAHPGCSAREARVNVVNDNPRRWTPAAAKLAGSLSRPPLHVDHTKLPADVRALVDAERGRVDAPPRTPPPSTSPVDGQGPTVDVGQRGPSTASTLSTEGGES